MRAPTFCSIKVLPVTLEQRLFWDILVIYWDKCVTCKRSKFLTFFLYLCPSIQSNCLRTCRQHSLQLHISPFQYFIGFLKLEMSYCFMSCGKSATVYFQGKLESLLQKMWSVSLGVQMHFCLVMAAEEIKVFLQFLFIF